MSWNPFRRPEAPAGSDSTFESTVVDEAAARALASQSADGTPTPAMPPAGPGSIAEIESIGHVGRYALKTILGKGGLGTVYAAWDPLLSRTVALKTLHIDADPAARELLDALFLNEARAAAGLSHPHIVTVFDAGPSDTGVYIAMERLQGQDLRHLLQQGVHPGPVEAAQLVRRVADALAYAHRKGVIHCDVKPANIFMTGRMHPKVLDFGIARVAHRDVPTLEGAVAGSPYYLAPEQLDGRPVDGRSDVYSLGVVLYELLTGKKPFQGSTLEEIAHAVKTADPVPAHQVSPKVPPGLSAITSRAMARDPEQRHSSARQLAMELRQWVESSEARALRNETHAPPVTAAPRARTSHRGVVAGLAGAALVAGAFAWMKTGGTSTALSAAAPVPAASLPVPVRVAAAAPSAPSVPPTPSAPAPAAVASAWAPPASMPSGPASAPYTAKKLSPTAAHLAAAPAVTSAAARTANRKVANKADATHPRKVLAIATPTQGASASRLPSEGTVQLALTPWGQVEVDGKPMGTSPPLARLTLSAGSHTITVRNTDFPAYSATVAVGGENPVVFRHRFGP